MQSYLRSALFFLLVFGTVSCASSVDNLMNSWMGHSEHELILSWGPPTQRDPDGAGGVVLTYVFSHQSTNPFSVPGRVEFDGRGNATYYPPKGGETTTHVKIRRFYVNSDGVIYSWWYRGL
jgi:hypothetical protein